MSQPYESSGAPPPHNPNGGANANNHPAAARASLRPDAAYEPYRSPAENGTPLRHYAHSQVSRTSLDSTGPGVAAEDGRGNGGRALDVEDMREPTHHKAARGTRNGCEACCGSCLSSCLTM